MPRLIVIGIALVVAMGGFVYGFDSGIIATTFGHDTFRLYFYGPSRVNTSLSGKIRCILAHGFGLTREFKAPSSLFTTLVKPSAA